MHANNGPKEKYASGTCTVRPKQGLYIESIYTLYIITIQQTTNNKQYTAQHNITRAEQSNRSE